MSKEINEIINNLCDKLGTSAKFLIPEMAKLNIAQDVFMVIFTAIMLAICAVMTVKAWKYDHSDGRDLHGKQVTEDLLNELWRELPLKRWY